MMGDTTTWHARLGHINFETVKMMVNKELVVGVPKIVGEK